MLRLLIALMVCGLLAYWLLRPQGSRTVVAGDVAPMLRTLHDNGCVTPDKLPANASQQQSYEALQQAIETCEDSAAHRDGDDSAAR